MLEVGSDRGRSWREGKVVADARRRDRNALASSPRCSRSVKLAALRVLAGETFCRVFALVFRIASRLRFPPSPTCDFDEHCDKA